MANQEHIIHDEARVTIFEDLGIKPSDAKLRLFQGILGFEHEGDVYYTLLNDDTSASFLLDDWGVADTYNISEEEFTALTQVFPFVRR